MTYNFKIVAEPDEDFDGHPSGWHAYCPSLERQGASTWGETEDDALKNIKELVRMAVESMLEHGDRNPEEPSDQVEVTVEPRVAVTVCLVPIDYGQLRNTTAREIISALIRVSPDLLPSRPADFHGGSTFKRKTLKSMIELQACWTDEDLKRFKLIR